ncbi:hypothetical protein AKJ09_01082 [Labilithrix luteola]|uniref:Uncharacterized protein n=1 Tax=Labilithrix luteola TaxID=1391654 RepID=A0A0K1PLK8_9BACT|nr:hypothetical protein [Labilithrix luteola]AKU94418.1 hypothetical protein AKJ09_01082 [Labilithrix luteola]
MNIRLTSFALLASLSAGCAGAHTNAPTPKEASSQPAGKSASANAAPFAVTIAKPRKTFPLLRQMIAHRKGYASIGQLIDLFAADEDADLERPVVFTTTGKDRVFAYSLAIVPGQEKTARAHLEKLGIAAVAGGKSGKFVCDVVRGSDGPRKVCAGNEETLATLGPGAVNVPAGMTSDLRFEMDTTVAAKMQKARKQAAKAAAGDTSKDASDAFVDTAVADLGRFTADVSYDGGFDVRLAMQVKGQSPIWHTVFEAPAKAPPTTFALLPEDSEIALFAHAPPPGATKELREIAEAALVSDCSEGDARAAREAFDTILFTGGSVAFAIGYDRSKAESAAKSLVGKAGSNPDSVERARIALSSWALFGFEEPTERWLGALRKLESLDCNSKGKTSSTKTRIVSPTKALGLPAGTTEFVEVHTAKNPKDKPKPTTYIFVVPDGSRTWLAIGEDELAIAARLRASVDPKGRHLGERVGGELLRTPATGAAVFSAEALAWAGHDLDSTPSILRSAELLVAAASMPTGGRTPIPVSFVSSPDGKGGELRLRSRVDSAAVGDVISFLASGDDSDDEDDDD